MSGIAALFARDGCPWSHAEIQSTMRTLLPYGREYQHVEVLEGVVLLYAHAAFVAEARSERQPALGGNGRYALLFDGRLDYREDLTGRLNLSQEEVAGRPDSWLAVRAFERWGSDFIRHLEGDFALIVWDGVEQRLVAARDRFGFRPLFYHLGDERLVIASMPYCVLAATGQPPRVDLRSIGAWLIEIPEANSRSPYGGVRRIPPAHVLHADKSYFGVRRYWSLREQTREVRLKADSDYVDQARELLDRAVEVRMRSLGRVGADITGGLDSSSVAVTALKFVEGKLPVFTVVPERGWDGRVAPGQYGDETSYVRDIVAMHPRLEPTFVSSEGRGWDHGIRDYFAAAGALPSVPGWVAKRDAMLATARDKGVKVMLSGDPGNLSISWNGVGAYLWWLRQGRLRTLFRELCAVSPNPVKFMRRLGTLVILPLSPDWLWKLYFRVRFGPPGEHSWARYALVNPDFARSKHVGARAPSAESLGRTPRDGLGMCAEILSSDDCDGGEFYQAMIAMYGIEYRAPLHDPRLIEWCLSIPEEQFLRNGQRRWLVRRVMAGCLPDSVLNNTSRGQPLADWHFRMTRDLENIREQLDVIASDPDVAALIDVPKIKKLLAEWPAETPIDDRDPRTVLWAYCLPHALAAGRLMRYIKGANM